MMMTWVLGRHSYQAIWHFWRDVTLFGELIVMLNCSDLPVVFSSVGHE